MKKLVLVALSVLMLASCNGAAQEIIKINGDVEQTIEVNTTFDDLGITYPEDKYTVVTTGKVQENRLGRYEIVYSIYTKEGELIKELHRFVNVVDTTPPTFTEAQNLDFYAGFTYPATYFVSDYRDNYNDKNSIVLNPTSFTFTSPGSQEVLVSFKDTSGNTSTYSKTIEVQLDMIKLINEVYKNNKSAVSTSQYKEDETYTNVRIDSTKSLGYFQSGSIHYLETVSTSLGKSASIQISANYGSFHQASLNYHISSTNSSNYAYGMISSFDVTQETATISKFQLFSEHGYQVDESAALNECNQKLSSVLKNFHEYFANTLHLDLR